MKDLNQITKEATVLRGKILKDLNTLIGLYGELEGSIKDRFRNEFHKNAGSINGLEDFYMLTNIASKNNIAVKNAYAGLNRMRDVGGFEIIEEEVLDKELENLLK
jgi:hypothetical protein